MILPVAVVANCDKACQLAVTLVGMVVAIIVWEMCKFRYFLSIELTMNVICIQIASINVEFDCKAPTLRLNKSEHLFKYHI